MDELRREMAESVDDYLEFCEEVGKEPERPAYGESQDTKKTRAGRRRKAKAG